jgi:hypothetical protein
VGPELTLLLYGGLVPAAVAGAGLLVAGLRRAPADPPSRGTGGAVLAAAFVASMLAGNAGRLPPFPAVGFHDWLFWLAPLLAVLGAIEPAVPRRWWWGARGLAGAGVATLVLWTPLTRTWSPLEGAAWLLATAGGIVALWAPLARLSEPGPRLRAAGVAAVTGIAAGIALAATHSLMLGQFATALGAASAAGVVLGTWRARFNFGPGFAAPFAGLLGACLASGAYYSELPIAGAVLLAAVPAAALGAVPLARRLGWFGAWVAPGAGPCRA